MEQDAIYLYDVGGQRVAKTTTPDGTTYYTRDAQGKVLSEFWNDTADASCDGTVVWQRDYIYADSELISAVDNADASPPCLSARYVCTTYVILNVPEPPRNACRTRGVHIWRRLESESYGLTPVTSEPVREMFRDEGLSPGVTYCYVARAMMANGAMSLPTDEMCITTVADGQPCPFCPNMPGPCPDPPPSAYAIERRFYVNDHLGSPRVVTDEAGTVIRRFRLGPFGETVTDDVLEPLGDPACSDTHRFTGHERDGESGLDYMHARYYENALGRFLSTDPLRNRDLAKPQGWNAYAYVKNNPLGLIDPTGAAVLVNNMTTGTLSFIPYPECPSCPIVFVPDFNGVVPAALPGAQNGFVTEDVAVVHDAQPQNAYGPGDAYIDTFDGRGRDIHGGGSSLHGRGLDALAPDQPLTATTGCTRGHNSDVQTLGRIITHFKEKYGVTVPYVRFGTPPGATHQNQTVSSSYGKALESGQLQIISPLLIPKKSSFKKALNSGALQLLYSKQSHDEVDR